MSYTRGTDLSGTRQGAGGIGGLLARTDHGGQALRAWAALHGSTTNYPGNGYYHCDGNGNVTYLMDPGQQLAAKYMYDPYGNMLAMAGRLAEANTYRFSSKEWNANSGIYYYLYRFYEPNMQRWLNRDPIQEQGGLNLYAYIGNSPVNYIDPHGLCTFGIVVNGEIDFLVHIGIHGGFHVGRDPDTKKWSFGFVGGPELGSGGPASADVTIGVQCTAAPKVKDLKGLGIFAGGGFGDGPVLGGDVTAGVSVDDPSAPIIPGVVIGGGVGGGLPISGHAGFSWDSDTGWGWK